MKNLCCLASLATVLVVGSVHVAAAAAPICSNETLKGSYMTANNGFNDEHYKYMPMGYAAVSYFDGKGRTDFTAINFDNTDLTLKGTYKVNDLCRGEISYKIGNEVRTVGFFVAPSGNEMYFVETGSPESSPPIQGRILAGVGHRVSPENLVGITP